MVKAKDLRDQCYTLLEKMMSEVWAAARFLFRKTPDTLTEFTDQRV